MNIHDLRKDFPGLTKEVNGKRLIYLDNAATTQKPKQVIQALESYYAHSNANPHRGAHSLSVEATDIYERARERVKDFIHAGDTKEIIFTKNATESLNMLAYTYGMNAIQEGDEIVISIMEHHSNLIPWQQVARARGASLKFLYVDERGRIPQREVFEKITGRTKLVGITHVSNALGTINPVKEIIEFAHSKNAHVVVDAAQSIPHMPVDVQDLEADFMVFSGHKMLGPMGIGVLYGKRERLEQLPPFLFGGNMIEYVHEDGATFTELPHRLEAGTQNVAGALGLMEGINYLERIGMDRIQEMESQLTAYALEQMLGLDFIEIYGPKTVDDQSGVISFNIKDLHPHDTATMLDAHGIAVRSGHHCAQPLMRHMKLHATTRASFYFYNTREEIDALMESLIWIRKWFTNGS